MWKEFEVREEPWISVVPRSCLVLDALMWTIEPSTSPRTPQMSWQTDYKLTVTQEYILKRKEIFSTDRDVGKMQDWQSQAIILIESKTQACCDQAERTAFFDHHTSSKAPPVDYYAALEIDSKASQQQIRDAYKKAALRFHPDRVPADSPERSSRTKKFQQVNDAYYTLSDTSRRRDYDLTRNQFHGFPFIKLEQAKQ
ncbi:hypothetical protein MRB53_041600 [Persea americana]|nr:hypothetical protein MRB53_041600 [Persea americana]